MGNRPRPVPAAVADVPKAEPDEKSSPRETQVHGVVVDEAGKPVAGAEVRADAFTESEARGVTGADGSFAITVPARQVDGMALLARSAGGDRLGFFQYGYNLTEAAARVTGADRLEAGPGGRGPRHRREQGPGAGAAVEVAGNFAVLDDATTGRDGSARLHVPADAKVDWIFGLKSGRGFDYAEFGPIDEQGRSQGGALATSLPGSVDLTLDGVRTARIKAVDGGGKPLARGRLLRLAAPQGRPAESGQSSRAGSSPATTGPDGIATFDWLPPSKDLLQFWPVDLGYARRRVTVEDGQTGPVTARLIRTEAIRGRVVRPDGSPAPGIEVHAYGTDRGIDNGQDRTRTAADGTYEMTSARARPMPSTSTTRTGRRRRASMSSSARASRPTESTSSSPAEPSFAGPSRSARATGLTRPVHQTRRDRRPGPRRLA